MYGNVETRPGTTTRAEAGAERVPRPDRLTRLGWVRVLLCWLLALSPAASAEPTGLDEALVGIWITAGVAPNGVAFRTVMCIDHGGRQSWWTFSTLGPLGDRGTFSASDGRFRSQSDLTKKSEEGTYALNDADHLVTTGPNGQYLWTRWLPGMHLGAEDALVGSWHLGGVAPDGTAWSGIFTVEKEGRYRLRLDGQTGGAEDYGRLAAASGKYATVSTPTGVIRTGRYVFEGGDAVTFTPEGEAASTWNRVGRPQSPADAPGRRSPGPDAGDPGRPTDMAGHPEAIELGTLFEDLLTALHAGDRTTVAAMAKEFAIPNAPAWFARVYGEGAAAPHAMRYADWSRGIENALFAVLERSQREQRSRVSAWRVIDATDPAATAAQQALLRDLAGRLPVYGVGLASAGGGPPLVVEMFVHEGEGFRWLAPEAMVPRPTTAAPEAGFPGAGS